MQIEQLSYILPVAGVVALAYSFVTTGWIGKQDAGNNVMKTIADQISKGAMAFLAAEYKVLAIFVTVVAAALVGMNMTIDGGSPLIGVAFVAGAAASAFAGYLGMKVATQANVRTAAAARKGLPPALTVAFRGGAVMGMSVVGLAMVGLGGLFIFFNSSFDRKASIPVVEVLESTWNHNAQTVSLEVMARQNQNITAKNVIGLIEGTSKPDSFLVVTAHYDHLGSLGSKVYFPGANDNASGTALLLGLAEYFSTNPPAYSMMFIGFSGEEVGLLGSRYYVTHPLRPLANIRFILNFDMVASAEKGIMVQGGSDYPEYWQRIKRLNDSETGPNAQLSKRKNSPNSDHYFFLSQGVKGFYLYTKNGKQPYHSLKDVPQTLEWDDYEAIFQLAKGFLEGF